MGCADCRLLGVRLMIGTALSFFSCLSGELRYEKAAPAPLVHLRRVCTLVCRGAGVHLTPRRFTPMLSLNDERNLALDLTLLLGYETVADFLASISRSEWLQWCGWWARKREGA